MLATATGPPTPSARKERAGAGKIEAIQIVELQPQVKEKHCKDEALGLAKWECLTKSLLHILKRYIYYIQVLFRLSLIHAISDLSKISRNAWKSHSLRSGLTTVRKKRP